MYNENKNYWIGKVAVIPGATHGIGLRLAQRLSELGVKIATIYRNNDDQAKMFQEAIPDSLIMKGDILIEDNIYRLIDATYSRWNRIDFLVNNIGNDCWKSIFDLTVEEWRRTQELLLNVPFITSKACLSIMRDQGFGRIVNIGASSRDYLKGQAGLAPFGVFKGALVIFSQTLALEEIKNGITVNIVAPGSTADAGVNPEEKRIPVSKIPIGRRITRDEITEAILYFLSENAAAVTGQFIGVNGGCSV